MTDTSEPPDIPELSSGLSREEAIALRESFDTEKQERIRRTVAELLDLLGKIHTMAVLIRIIVIRYRHAGAVGPCWSTRPQYADCTAEQSHNNPYEAGLLGGEADDEVLPRVEYTPTEKAESLFPVFAHLHHLAIEHEL